MTAGLQLSGLRAGYLGKDVIFDVSFDAAAGCITALFGHNGAGKTTTLRSVAGLHPVRSGEVRLGSADLSRASSTRRVRAGLMYLPQEKATFGPMTVRENLLLGCRADRSARVSRLRSVFELFPRLAERQEQTAATMSGGEQRMLSLGIAFMAGATMLLLDEPSLGLAPAVYESLLMSVKTLVTETHVGAVLVEQAIGPTLDFVDRVHVMRSGRIIASYTQAEAQARDNWWQVF